MLQKIYVIAFGFDVCIVILTFVSGISLSIVVLTPTLVSANLAGLNIGCQFLNFNLSSTIVWMEVLYWKILVLYIIQW